jgi:hypothetical protein
MLLTVMTTSTGKKSKFQSISTILKLRSKRIQSLIKARTSLLSYSIAARFLLILARKKGIPHAERLLRINCHKIHTIALIVNAQIRNKWINDPLLHVGRLYRVKELSCNLPFRQGFFRSLLFTFKRPSA